MEIIGITFICLAIVYLIYQQARLIYNRYIRTYEPEIQKYLAAKDFEFIETVIPNDNDWRKSPFTKPPDFGFSLLIIRLNGVNITWTRKHYLIITGHRKGKIREFWLEKKTTYFQKPVLSFREGRAINPKLHQQA